MRKTTFVQMLCVLAFAVGCSSAPPKAAAPVVKADATYAINDFTLQLNQKRQVDGYLVQEDLSKAVHDQIISDLKNNNLLADAGNNNAVQLSITVNYQRRFAGEDTPFPSRSVMAPIIGYTIVVLENAVENGRITRSGLTTQKGFFNNLKTAATMGLGNNAQAEAADIKQVANAIAAELIKLRK